MELRDVSQTLKSAGYPSLSDLVKAYLDISLTKRKSYMMSLFAYQNDIHMQNRINEIELENESIKTLSDLYEYLKGEGA